MLGLFVNKGITPGGKQLYVHTNLRFYDGW